MRNVNQAMEIKKISLSSLKTAETYCLSYPVRPEIYQTFARQFPGFPAIIMNPDRDIIFGIDAYNFFKSQGEKEITVFETRISMKEGLFLNYNLKEKLLGLNRFEKLVFLKKILPLSNPSEIHQRTHLDITVNQELIDNLESLIVEDLMAILINDRLNLKSALKILKFSGPDRASIICLLERFSFSVSHQKTLLDMLEEISFRDKKSIEDIFNRAGIYRLFEMKKPQKEIMKAIFSLRFPSYSKTEENWKTWIKKLRLPRNIQIQHTDYFEKKQLKLTLLLNDPKEVEKVLNKIKK